MFKKVTKNTSILSLGTFVSLFLGFFRDILVAYFFNTSRILEAFIVAFRLPNVFRNVLGEGFADSISIPVLSEYSQDKEKLFEVSNHLNSVFIIILSILTVLGMVFSKYLVVIMAPGFMAQPDKFALAVSFTRITFLYLFLIGVAVNLTSILYALKQFFVPAINPSFLNIAFLIGIPFFVHSLKNYILVICVVAGGVFQVILPLIILYKQGFKIKYSFISCWRDSEIIRMMKLFPPRVLSSIVYHLSVWLDTLLSSFTYIVGEGAICAIYFANRLVHVPLALIALPISRVAIVDLSAYSRDGDMDEFKKLLVFSINNTILLVVPITIFMMFLSNPIIDVIFKRGSFSDYSLSITASVLFFYSFGLFFFCVAKVLLSAFYAIKDTYTPAKTTAISLAVNAILSVILMFPLKIGGVALGSSFAAGLNCYLLHRLLVKRIGKIDLSPTFIISGKVFILSVVIGLFSRIGWHIVELNKYFKIIIIFFCAFFIFLWVGRVIGLVDLDSFLIKVRSYFKAFSNDQ